MKKIIQILICIHIGFISYAQSQEFKIKGVLIDSLNNPIKYANIGVLRTSLGTVTNENGEFIINLSKKQFSDTLKFSCLGYKSKKILVNDLLNQNSSIKKIYLKEHSELLEEIILTAQKRDTYTKGKEKIKTRTRVNFAISNKNNLNLGAEIGRKFMLGSKRASLIENLKFYLLNNNFKAVKFRINIYGIHKNKPFKKLNDSNLIIDVNDSFTGWVNIDLSTYGIKVQQNIIISVEWISSSGDGNALHVPIIIPSFNSTHYYKFGSQAKWKTFSAMSIPMVLTYKQ